MAQKLSVPSRDTGKEVGLILSAGRVRARHPLSVTGDSMSVSGTDWNQSCELFELYRKRPLLRGRLALAVASALAFKSGIRELAIRTDDGALYCTNEIRLLSLDRNYPLSKL